MSAAIARAIGPSTLPAVGGGFNMRDRDGRVTHTHGPDARTSLASGSRAVFDAIPGRAPVCVADPATDYHQRVLYAYLDGQTDERAIAIPDIRAIVAQLNFLLNQAALESSAEATTADYKVACDEDGNIDVGVFSTPSTTFEVIKASADSAGFNLPKVDYSIFLDAPAESYAGIGDTWGDDRLVADNANNNPVDLDVSEEPGIQPPGPSYAVTHGGPSAPAVDDYWPTTTPMHENGHNQGAVQDGAPNSTLRAHCTDGIDVMCYDDSGPNGVYGGNGGNYVETACAEEKYDCGYDDYFDAATEPDEEYLDSFWNIGSPLNRFIEFGVAGAQVRLAASSLSVPESVGTVNLVVQRVGDPTAAIQVTIDTDPGSAVTPADFTDVPTRTVSFGANDTVPKLVPVTIANDQTPETLESFTATLSNPTSGVTLGTSTETISIRASDQRPDERIALSGGSYVGTNIYYPTVQKREKSLAQGKTQTFFVRIYNAGGVRATNYFRIKGTNAQSGTTVTYRNGRTGALLPSAFRTSAGISTGNILPGRYYVVRIDVKVLSSAKDGSKKSFYVQSAWTGDGIRYDRAYGFVKVV